MYIKTNINKDSVKYRFVKPDGYRLTYAEFIDLLKNSDKDFSEELKAALNNAKSELNSAYQWECPPISQNTINQPFEFVVTKLTSLNNMKQNYASFREHIDRSISNGNNDVCSFPNLGKDANLVVPIPREGKDYKNLAEFVNNSSARQWREFWREIANNIEESLRLDNNGKSPKWLSTHGAGVPYLHVRIDRNPKYYSHDKYRNVNYKAEEDKNKFENIKQNIKEWDFKEIVIFNGHYYDWEKGIWVKYSEERKELMLINKSAEITYDEQGNLIFTLAKMYKKDNFSIEQWTELEQALIHSQQQAQIEQSTKGPLIFFRDFNNS